ncbi:hypothetical protein SAMN05216302_10431 [Nitrosomonas aestuarii]|uniref:Uncharacterized protein n=1 Tax=Nitrosomonas aestuarii TaxID=52441 RepID=A0A1I4FXA8_9PROT|nr:hypothetical protein [Nitrosomonas aestuarii]SFL21341.1 hypothetical protein SAMN05216302_10431 [Nitrosomonas aestuarii]
MNFNGLLTGLLLRRNLNGLLAMMTLAFGLVAISKAENAIPNAFSQPPLA